MNQNSRTWKIRDGGGEIMKKSSDDPKKFSWKITIEQKPVSELHRQEQCSSAGGGSGNGTCGNGK